MQDDGLDTMIDEPAATPVSDVTLRPAWIMVALHAAPVFAAAAGALGPVVHAFRGPANPGFGMGGWRVVVATLLFWASATVGRTLASEFRAAAFTTWWDPAWSPDGDLTWNHLLRLVEPAKDPMQNAGVLRPRIAIRHGFHTAIVVAAMFACARVTASWLALPRLPEFLTLGGTSRLSLDALINVSGNLTAFLALVAAAASLWFANSQLRAKVRADNRRDWLARARKLLAEVIALAREHARAKDPNEVNNRLDSLRLRFELMLNPREKDHRLLMHLLRRLAFPHEPARAEAADGGAFLKALRKSCADDSAKACDAVGACNYEVDWKPIVECSDTAVLTTYVMRLGHVVLKREWERVKAAR